MLNSPLLHPRSDSLGRADFGPIFLTFQDNRRFGEAVLSRYRAGIPWRDLPDRLGHDRKIHTRFRRWAKTGVWERVFQTLASARGLSTKIHATCDALGNPTGLHLTPGQVCDLDGADVLVVEIPTDTVLAAKGYDADEQVIERLAAQGKTAVISPKRNRKTLCYSKSVNMPAHLVRLLLRYLKFGDVPVPARFIS